jgi:predicted outer membrane protein
MTSDHRGGLRHLLRVFLLPAVAALAVIGPIAPAQAHSAVLADDYGPTPADTSQSQGAAQDPGGAVRLDTQSEPALTAADRDLVVRVRLAGLWEIPAGQMAMTKGVEPRVRQIGQMISSQHVKLNALDATAAAKLGVKLPTEPTGEQKRWLGEMRAASGPEFDTIFVQRLRAAHGKIFPAIAVVRATTRNDVVRTLAQQANGFVLNHLTYLESTGLVQFAELPKVAAPATVTGPVAAAERRSANGGIAVPLIWLILAVALVSGGVASTRMIRPRGFGGRPNGDVRPVMRADVRSDGRPMTRPLQVVDREPLPPDDEDDYPYPYPRPRTRMRSGS